MSDLTLVDRLAFLRGAVGGATGLILGGTLAGCGQASTGRIAKRGTLKEVSQQGAGF